MRCLAAGRHRALDPLHDVPASRSQPAFAAVTAVSLLSAASPLHAAETAAAASPPGPDLAVGLGQMAFGLAVVIALLFACLWVIRRLSAPRGSAASALKVLGAVAVGPRERVVLVGLGDTVLVLGVAPGQVRTLHVLPADELPTLAGGTAAAVSMKDFPAWLRQAMERRHEP